MANYGVKRVDGSAYDRLRKGRHVPVRFLWDPAKYQRNLERHGLDFGIITIVFLADAIIRPANGRLQAIGVIDGRAVSLIFSPLGSEAVSLISLRLASARERALL